jgi:hypothetical protein
METHDLASWDEFRPLMHDMRKRCGAVATRLSDGTPSERANQLLFRGQADSEWELQTSLERRSAEPFDVPQYMLAAKWWVNELESFTGKRWNIKPWPDLKQEINTEQNSMRVYLPHYEYLVYLRQHGFPSPLLDWTESPYIAAYFAFCDQGTANRAAVYAYIETPTGGKLKRGGHPMITVNGPYVRTDATHFAQKAWYTVATKWSCKRKSHSFCPHGDVFRTAFGTQDVLMKITLPADQRRHVLRDLNDYNINHFTLFQSEDSLVKALAMKCFDMKAI